MFDVVPDPSLNPKDLVPATEVDIIEQIIEEHMSKAPDDLTPEEKGRILDFAPMVEQWLKDLRKSCEKDLLEGKQVEGYKLIQGRGSREWAESEEEAVAAALKKLGLKVGDIYTKKLVSPAQAEKIPTIAENKTKANKLKNLWTKKAGKPTLVPESDPAPGIDPLHAEMFDSLDEMFNILDERLDSLDDAQPPAEESFDWM